MKSWIPTKGMYVWRNFVRDFFFLNLVWVLLLFYGGDNARVTLKATQNFKFLVFGEQNTRKYMKFDFQMLRTRIWRVCLKLLVEHLIQYFSWKKFPLIFALTSYFCSTLTVLSFQNEQSNTSRIFPTIFYWIKCTIT